jgi:hypothetical protein
MFLHHKNTVFLLFMSFRQFENKKFFQCKITLERSLFYWLELFVTCPFHYRLI